MAQKITSLVLLLAVFSLSTSFPLLGMGPRMPFMNPMLMNRMMMQPRMMAGPAIMPMMPSPAMGVYPGVNPAMIPMMDRGDIGPYGPDRTVGGVTVDGSDISYGF